MLGGIRTTRYCHTIPNVANAFYIGTLTKMRRQLEHEIYVVDYQPDTGPTTLM